MAQTQESGGENFSIRSVPQPPHVCQFGDCYIVGGLVPRTEPASVRAVPLLAGARRQAHVGHRSERMRILYRNHSAVVHERRLAPRRSTSC